MIESIKKFMKFVKQPDMTITEFLAGFDTAYNTAIKKGLDKLPQPYLSYMIMENAGVKSQWTKRMQLYKALPPHMVDEMKDLLSKSKTAAGATAYYEMKQRLVTQFGPNGPINNYVQTMSQ